MSNEPDKLKQGYEQERLNSYLEKKYQLRSQQFAELSKKSFIISKDNNQQNENPQDQSELNSLITKIRRMEYEKKKVNESSFWDKEYVQYLIRNNSDIVTLLLLETTGLIVTYPINTIKTRIQSRHPLEDVCFFNKNQVIKQPLYKGISQAMISTTIGTFLNNISSRFVNLELQNNEFTSSLNNYQKNTISLCIADIISAPFRIAFDVKKMFIQMNIQKFEMKQYRNAILKSFMPSLLRDDPYQAKLAQIALNKKAPHATYEQKVTAMVSSTMIALFLSNPFDMVATRLSVQGYSKYSGIINCFKTIVREEKISKLFLSGYWARTMFYLLNGSIIMNLYDKLLFMVDDAYGYD